MGRAAAGLLGLACFLATVSEAAPVDLTNAVVVVRPGILPKSEQKAAVVLVEEVRNRTGLTWTTTTALPETGVVIRLAADPGAGPASEGYHLYVEAGARTIVHILGADGRGVLYGVGKLLRTMEWSSGSVQLPDDLDVTSAPAYPIRGHQIGYRNTSNTCDGWTAAQYEQYLRDLVVFGANAIENIPLHADNSPHYPITPEAMNDHLSTLCDDYGIEYWAWIPVSSDLSNATSRANELALHEAFYDRCARLDGVFIPGGDPGNNPPELLLPFIAELHTLLVARHPNAGIWLSNQQFTAEENDTLFSYLETQRPNSLAGLVYGPWTWMTLEEMRSRTPIQYAIRSYPDITHTVRCQFPVAEWDRALAHTLNREAPNPRPVAEAALHNRLAPQTQGFIAYSDGAHDDVNKQIWNARGWDPDAAVTEILRDYARYFFGPDVAEDAAEGIRGLEQNWTGPLATNPSVNSTFELWQGLESSHPGLSTNWRWQFCLMRAYYDKLIQERLAFETDLEDEARQELAAAPQQGPGTALADARAVLDRATTEVVRGDLHAAVADLGQGLFQSVHYQCSVQAPYLASGLERSCLLDLVDWPVNDRLWLQSEFTRIGNLGSDTQRLAAIRQLLNWEDPGPGGYYDDLGHAGKQPHLVQQKNWADDPGYVESTQCEFSWHGGDRVDPRKGAARLSWQDHAQTLYGQPLQMRYTGLAPDAAYTVRATCLGRFNAVLTLNAEGVALGTSGTPPSAPYQVAYAVPLSATSDGVLDLSWDLVSGRGCQVAEVWLTTPDSDNDGLPDYWEQRYGLTAANGGASDDADNDGLGNLDEFSAGTAANTADTDGDGYWDGLEHQHGSNPLSPSETPAPTGVEDDVNLDGAVNALDVQMVVNAVLGLPVAAPTDVDGNGPTNAVDVQHVVNSVLGA